ncbi:MAG: GGDEF domain-containing protein, partial [Candidatus Aenigmatarchaeota archaeon]
ADNYAERIRKKINQIEVESVPTEISACLGVSEMKDGDDSESLLKRADAALYEAKAQGKNRVCSSA